MSDRGQVVITGAVGGIGRALCATFAASGYLVIATDVRKGECDHDVFVEADLDMLCTDDQYRESILVRLNTAITGGRLTALVNNAAVQILGSTTDIDASDLQTSLQVNVVAPFLLARGLLPALSAAGGSIVNIGSIHAELTKPGFVAYATSKSALAGLTRALAVDLGGRVRVNAVHPAATRTEMLLAGFEGQSDVLTELESMHPAGRLASPDEVAAAAAFLVSRDASFITGACLGVDGGIAARLHDPV